MSLKNIVTALAAVSLATAPTMAAAQDAPDQGSEESSERDDDSGVGQILPIFVIAAIVLIIRELVKDDDSGDPPISP
jgi:hypothetical protein